MNLTPHNSWDIYERACLAAGWNYFQDNPEFLEDVVIEKSGYFVTSKWWDNPSTTAILTLDKQVKIPNLKDIIAYIYSVLTLRTASVLGEKANDISQLCNKIADLLEETASYARQMTAISETTVDKLIKKLYYYFKAKYTISSCKITLSGCKIHPLVAAYQK